ncbi:cell division protein PerM [Aeromicrobium alkaliterrae]|uniref:Integral membrane protein n=1 Tax=Aeromicrobium alkaliterrae TaxID=302168 RepID=A0ABN2KBV6_9ACTN
MPSPARISSSDDLRSAVWPGAVAAIWAAVVGWVLTVVLLVAAGAGDGVVGTIRASARVWLVAQGSGISADGADITLVPWGGVLLALTLVVLVARRQAREPVSEPAAFAATAAGVYAVLASIVTSVANDAAISVPTIRAALVTFVLAGVGAAIAYVSVHGAPAAWWPEDQPEVLAVLRGAASIVVTVLGVALVLVALLLARHVEQAGSLWALLDPGLGGGIALAVVCLLLVPTLALWAAAALLGPGFQVGTNTSVDLTSADLGQVPGLPVLAALPAPGELPTWALLLGLVPVVAAGWAGWRLVRRGQLDLATDFWRGVSIAAGAGAAGAVALALLTWMSGGAVGPGRMAEVGPESLLGLLAVLPFLAVAAAVGAVAAHYRGGRATAA